MICGCWILLPYVDRFNWNFSLWIYLNFLICKFIWNWKIIFKSCCGWAWWRKMRWFMFILLHWCPGLSSLVNVVVLLVVVIIEIVPPWCSWNIHAVRRNHRLLVDAIFLFFSFYFIFLFFCLSSSSFSFPFILFFLNPYLVFYFYDNFVV